MGSLPIFSNVYLWWFKTNQLIVIINNIIIYICSSNMHLLRRRLHIQRLLCFRSTNILLSHTLSLGRRRSRPPWSIPWQTTRGCILTASTTQSLARRPPICHESCITVERKSLSRSYLSHTIWSAIPGYTPTSRPRPVLQDPRRHLWCRLGQGISWVRHRPGSNASWPCWGSSLCGCRWRLAKLEILRGWWLPKCHYRCRLCPHIPKGHRQWTDRSWGWSRESILKHVQSQSEEKSSIWCEESPFF